MSNRGLVKYDLLDAWRGWAALWVVLYHGYNIYAGRQNFVLEHLPGIEKVATSGWFGVHLFFVISGYCIGTNLTTAWRKNRNAGQFLGDRLLRIFPVYWCALVAQIVLQAVSSPFNQTPWRQALPASLPEALANFLLLEPYFGFSSRLMVSWSLVYEWGFYVLMAAGLLYLRIQPKREVAFLGGILLALAGLLGFHCGILLPLKFWPEFMIGVCVFAFLQNGRPLWRGLVLAPFIIFPIVLWFREGLAERCGMMAGAVGFGLLLCILHKWDKPLSGSKPLRWLRRVGLFSYSLYLVHVPFGGAFRNLCMRFVSETSPGFAIVQIGYVTTCLITAYVFHRFVEAPWEKFRKSTFC